MLRKYLLSAVLICSLGLYLYDKAGLHPIELNWQMLGNISFNKTWQEKNNGYVRVPDFSDTLKKLNGHLVSIKGFVIPMEYGSRKFALSRNPNSSCFFCSGAGIETIIIVLCKKKQIDYPNDAFIEMSGKLKLSNSHNDFIYTLSDAY